MFRFSLLAVATFVLMDPSNAFTLPGMHLTASRTSSISTGPVMLFGKKAAKKVSAKKAAKKVAKKAAKVAGKKGSPIQFGVPVFLANGAVNPEFKRREREAEQKKSAATVSFFNNKAIAMAAKGVFTLGDVQLKSEGKAPTKDGPSQLPTGISRSSDY